MKDLPDFKDVPGVMYVKIEDILPGDILIAVPSNETVCFNAYHVSEKEKYKFDHILYENDGWYFEKKFVQGFGSYFDYVNEKKLYAKEYTNNANLYQVQMSQTTAKMFLIALCLATVIQAPQPFIEHEEYMKFNFKFAAVPNMDHSGFDFKPRKLFTIYTAEYGAAFLNASRQPIFPVIRQEPESNEKNKNKFNTKNNDF